MSKVVRSVGKAIGSVVKGAVNVVKKVAKSKLGKAALLAAGVFFGVPAVSGLFGAGATGTVMGNLSAAWSGLTGAASSAMAGNFAQAGTQLAQGSGLLGGAATGTTGGSSALAASPAAVGGWAPGPTGLLMAPAEAAAAGAAGAGATAAASPGLMGGLLSAKGAVPALITAGGQVLSGVGQAQMQRSQNQREDQLRADEIARVNKNVGTQLWPMRG